MDERRRGCLIGLAVVDALGAAVEFKRPGSFSPVTGYRSGGPQDNSPSNRICLTTKRRSVKIPSRCPTWSLTMKHSLLSAAVGVLCYSLGTANADIIYSNLGPGQTFQPGGYSVSGSGMTVLPPNG